MGKGIFGGMFDLNGDGNLDAFEQGLEFQAFNMMLEYEKKKKEAAKKAATDIIGSCETSSVAKFIEGDLLK